MSKEIIEFDLDGPEEDFARSKFVDELFERLSKEEEEEKEKQTKSEE